jgi:outer membrane murein-binding lipoprotein Lpp
MLDSNENDGVHHENGLNGNGAEAKRPRKKRVSTSDLNARIAELEKKLEAGSSAEQKFAQIADQIAKLDERVSKIAHAVAQFNLTRPGALA